MTERLITFLSRTEVWFVAMALAASLALFWALRGAPPGQATPRDDEDEDAPGEGYRDRVVAAMVGGLLLILAGANLALSGRLAWSIPAFALGFGIVLTLIAANRRYRHGSPSLRRTTEIANLGLSAIMVAGILIVANVLAFRYGGRALDFTREKTFTLSSLTTNQLKSLKKPVAFTVFFGKSARSARQLDRLQQLFDLYKTANPERVAVAYLNPYSEVERFDAIQKKFPDVSVTQGGGVLIEYGEGSTADHVVIRNNDLFDVGTGARFDENTTRFETNFKGEDAITSALIRLREGKRPKLALIVGHGEPSTAELDPRKAGLGLFKSRLTALGNEVVEVSLIREAVPSEAALVAIVGPRSPFNADEIARLKAAMDAGKPLLAVVGGPEASDEKAGLEDLLRSYNLAIESSVVVEPRLNFRGQPFVIYAPIVGTIRHPIVDSLANRPVLMPRSSPIAILTAPAANMSGGTFNQSVLPTAILQTSLEAWGETDLASKKLEKGKDDRPGPLTLGVAVTDRPEQPSAHEPKPRIVLFSSRYMADNLFLEVEPTNLDLLMNAINWLRGQAELGGIAPKTHVALTLSADPLLRARLIMVPTVMAVLLIVGLGLTTYLARRE
jgi:hypothetical protein